jgi:hypothetical protein
MAKAAETHAQGLLICEDGGDIRSTGWARLALGDTARLERSFDLAQSQYALAARSFEMTGSKSEITHVRLAQAELSRNRGDCSQATGALLDQVVDAYETLRLEHCLALALLVRCYAGRGNPVDDRSRGESICHRYGLDWVLNQFQTAAKNPDVGDVILPLNYP